MSLKITFELSEDAAFTAALNAGAPDDDSAELSALGIQRRSRFKQIIKGTNQYEQLKDYQSNGYHIVEIEVA